MQKMGIQKNYFSTANNHKEVCRLEKNHSKINATGSCDISNYIMDSGNLTFGSLFCQIVSLSLAFALGASAKEWPPMAEEEPVAGALGGSNLEMQPDMLSKLETKVSK